MKHSTVLLIKIALVGLKASLLSIAISNSAGAQTDADFTKPQITIPHPVIAPPVMEETRVFGRLISGAESLALERQDQVVATDYLGAEQIGRVGDSTVAIALTRVPGVTLVDDKFVFVRGLGERYSSIRLNGAMVPSPDLSRNVLPLDIFPTSIVESLAIQKVPSADKPAAFGGGSVNIRTTGIPDGFLFSLEVGTGTNTESSDVLTYNGGSDDRWGEDDGTRALSGDIINALNRYLGNFTPSNINRIDNLDSVEEANAINRSLATELNRDLTLHETAADPDLEGAINLGNSFYLPRDIEVGFLAGASYDSGWRHRKITRRKFSNPTEQVGFEDESTYSVDLAGNFGVGAKFSDEHTVETTSLFLRNTDDKATENNYFGANRLLSDGRGYRNTELRYEQREMTVHQIHGEHEFGSQTMDALHLNALSFLEELSFNWYISDSEATTDLPNEVNALSNTVTDPQTGEVISSALSGANSSAVTYRYSELRDDVNSEGWVLTLPVDLGKYSIGLSGGVDAWQKSRTYQQLEFNLGAPAMRGNNPIFEGPLGEVLSDANLQNSDNGFRISTNRRNANSYVAESQVDAVFGKIDVTWNNTLRAVIGSRREDYQQFNLPWDPISYDGNRFSDRADADIYTNDDTYTSAALTWMVQDFWAEDFQLRLSFGETTVRPDLREISSSSYFDPLTHIAVRGSPDVIPSQIDNYDLRAEWFFSNSDNFTLSLFYKDIVDPIELFEGAATDDNIAAEIHNADSAEVAGVELEFLKTLGGLAETLEPFFIQGNVTLLDHELIAGDNADAPTNPVRPLQGASDEVVNLILGFDSSNGQHAATLAYNAFSERLFFAGRNGAPDSYEQPFHSLDLTYSYYPLDTLTVKLKVKNLLDQDVTLERTNSFSDGTSEDIEMYKQKRGQDISLSVKYTF